MTCEMGAGYNDAIAVIGNGIAAVKNKCAALKNGNEPTFLTPRIGSVLHCRVKIANMLKRQEQVGNV